jgi:ribosomal protein S18 acetylase RimI-like enzyme
MIIRPAHQSDAPAMGRMMVETYLLAHKGQIPDGAWQRRQEEWTWEVSAKGWSGTISEIADGLSPKDCIYLAVDEEAGEAQEQVVGLVMGGPAEVGPWEQAGEIYALYVRQAYQRNGLGQELIQAAVRHLRQAGINRLVIRSLVKNEPANQFYESLGGQIVGERESEDYGFPIVEQIYGWEDSARLLRDEQDQASVLNGLSLKWHSEFTYKQTKNRQAARK